MKSELFSVLQICIDNSIARIKEFEKVAISVNEAGYYVCISGGKDSSVIQQLCIMAGVKCEFIHNLTSIDHPETVHFIHSEKKRLVDLGYNFRIDIPRDSSGKQLTMWNGIVKYGLPTQMVRWCCGKLKEFGGVGRYVITGVRWAESPKRKKRGFHEVSTVNIKDKIIINNDNEMKRRLNEMCVPKQKFILNPIIDWTDIEVWEFLKKYNVPVNPLYSKGYKRIGCIGCPMIRTQKIKELNNNPKYKNAYFKAVQKYFDHRKERNMSNEGVMESPEKYFEWWLGS